MTRALAALLLLAAPASAQPPIPPAAVTGAAKIDGVLKVAPYKLVKLSVAADKAEAVHWRVSPAEKVDYATPTADSPSLAFVAPPGKYTVEAFVLGLKDGKPTLRIDSSEVVIGDAAPPKPPEPPPAPPAPNPYRLAFKAAFDADAGLAADKDVARLKLVELWRLAPTAAADLDVTTTDVLMERLRRATATLASDQLHGLRDAIGGVIRPVLPPGTPLTPESRLAAAALFRQVAEALAW